MAFFYFHITMLFLCTCVFMPPPCLRYVVVIWHGVPVSCLAMLWCTTLGASPPTKSQTRYCTGARYKINKWAINTFWFFVPSLSDF